MEREHAELELRKRHAIYRRDRFKDYATRTLMGGLIALVLAGGSILVVALALAELGGPSSCP